MTSSMKSQRPTMRTDEERLRVWLSRASTGDALEYHRGFLAMDRNSGGPTGDDAGKELGQVADAAMALARSGHIHLVQRRHGSCDYTYIAVASRLLRPRPASGTRPEETS